jgi:hypothetical protein
MPARPIHRVPSSRGGWNLPTSLDPAGLNDNLSILDVAFRSKIGGYANVIAVAFLSMTRR